MSRSIEIYTDGGCSNKHNKAAIAFVILDNDKEITKYARLLNNEKKVTNNIAELMSIISALKWIIDNIDYSATYYVNSDSQYVVLGMNERIYNWIDKNWRTSARKPVRNKDLWVLLLEYKNILKSMNDSKIYFQWVRGHKKNINYNVVVDELCSKLLE